MELARNLRRDPVSRLEPAAPLTVEADAPVCEAVDRMRRGRVGCILVCEAGRLTGVFTERDLMCRVLGVGKPLSAPMRDCMTTPPVVLKANETIRVAVRRMKAGGYRHLPVVDDDHRPTGILSVKKVVRLVEHYPSAVYNIPPDPDAVPDRAEGA
jgi:CBS domain-containing protein